MGKHASRTRTGFTLIEILIVIAIIAILAVLAVVAVRPAVDSVRKANATATMRTILAAIEDYSRWWPASGRAVAGFPEWSAANLWVTPPPPSAAYTVPSNTQNEANECLAYSLLAQVGEGPHLRKPPHEMIGWLTQDFATRYSLGAWGKGVPVRQLLDPWGTPIAYQWLDDERRPVLDNRAVGSRVRLFSAGPDQKFGQRGNDQEEQDNIYDGPKPDPDESLFAPG